MEDHCKIGQNRAEINLVCLVLQSRLSPCVGYKNISKKEPHQYGAELRQSILFSII